MQEVVVRQRSAFKHLVEVERPGKEISWTFHTKKKNISFGVFRKTHTGTTTPNGVKTADAHEGPEGTLQRFRHASEGGFFGGRSSMASLPSSMQLDIQAGEREGSTRSGVDISPGSLSQGEDSPAGKKRGSKFTGERDLVEVVKVRHYESSKFQITGSFYVDEAGIYVLVFDNTFSVNTPKKLFFSVSVQDIGTQVSPTQQKTVEGWILKKGNRNFQGYAKRWMRIDPDGTLSYFKEPGSPLRGSVQLQSAAVRADHGTSRKVSSR
ncbi:hypothetical protein BJ742DRAFT_264869 [Cladochytrium replicatum]|nr:hypothetical protein BJ742DRAFT_264869 [Cladochytrium replicatum]